MQPEHLDKLISVGGVEKSGDEHVVPVIVAAMKLLTTFR